METQPLTATASAPTSPTISRDDIERALMQHGYRITTPRRAVVDTLLTYGRPFTAEQLVADVRHIESTQMIGRATVYRTLEILAAINVLNRIIQADGHPAYICDTIGHHHHLVCSNCGRAVAFTACPIDELVRSLTANTDFVINDHLLEVFGVCPNCQAA